MAKSIDIYIDNSWVDLNTVSGIAVGTPVAIQNKGLYAVLVQESDLEPETTSEGKVVTTLGGGSAEAYYDESSLKLWAYCASPNGTTISVQA